MPHDSKLQTLNGRLRQILFSPKGGLEGLILEIRDKLLQVSMDASSADPIALERAVGKAIEVQAQQDHSPKTRHGAHPVYQLRVIKKLGGKPYAPRDREATAIRGVVAAIHYAKHGEPNGVVLEDGEFIHTRPDGMRKLNLEIGAKVVVRGDTRMTVLGTSLIEASEVNGVSLGG